MTFVIAWRAFTALQHSCILYCWLLGGMCVHFKFPRLACMRNLYCISCVFGDWPLGDLNFRLVLADECCLSLWRGRVWAKVLWVPVLSCVLSFSKTRPRSGHFTNVRLTRGFGFELSPCWLFCACYILWFIYIPGGQLCCRLQVAALFCLCRLSCFGCFVKWI